MITYKVSSKGEIVVRIPDRAAKLLLMMIEDGKSDEELGDWVTSYLHGATSPISTSRKIQNSQLSAVLSSMPVNGWSN